MNRVTKVQIQDEAVGILNSGCPHRERYEFNYPPSSNDKIVEQTDQLKCDPMRACCAADHLWVGLTPVNLFVRTFRAHVVLLESRKSWF